MTKILFCKNRYIFLCRDVQTIVKRHLNALRNNQIYPKVLNYLNLAEKTPNKQFKLKIFRIIYQLKGDAYCALKDAKQVAYCDKTVAKLDSIIDDFKKNSNFYEIDIKYQTEEKNKQISSLSQLINMYHSNRILYLSLIFIVFILALYSFIRWKKVDKMKKNLFDEKNQIEIEHPSTIQELEKIKKLVIEDHIVLKNKAKIYLNELLYIKSDDHYLEFYTIKKKEFLRGKISEIIGQLLPILCKHTALTSSTKIILRKVMPIRFS